MPEGGVISESWCSWDAVFWEGMQSWQENVENHGVLGTRSSSIPCPGDAGIPVLELEHSAPHTNLKTGNQAVIKPKSSAGLHPKTFPSDHTDPAHSKSSPAQLLAHGLCLFSHGFILSVTISKQLHTPRKGKVKDCLDKMSWPITKSALEGNKSFCHHRKKINLG